MAGPVAKRYERLRTIASGGMATVYLGRVVGAGGFERLVAIKVMHPHIASDPEFVAMFLDEARLAARIRHPNVVSTTDVVQTKRRLFLVMDYVEGPSLEALLRTLRQKGGQPQLGVTLRIFLDLLAGLHAAHELAGPDGKPLELVHRDVSPQNVLVGTDGLARITDFGVAQARSRIATTRVGHIKGKLAYVSPEQVMCEKLDRRCDVYSAGAVLWEMLTGRQLFVAENELGLATLVLDGVQSAPSEVNRSVPRAIDEVATRALAVDRDERFSTAAAFAEALEMAAAAEGLEVASPRAVAALVQELGVHRAAPAQIGDGESSPTSMSESDPPDAPRFLEDEDTASSSTVGGGVGPRRRTLWRVTGMLLIGAVGLAAGLLIAARGRGPRAASSGDASAGVPLAASTADPVPVASSSATPPEETSQPAASASAASSSAPRPRGWPRRPTRKPPPGRELPREL